MSLSVDAGDIRRRASTRRSPAVDCSVKAGWPHHSFVYVWSRRKLDWRPARL